jgi:hypothetical protein
MKKYFIKFSILILTLWFTACGSTTSSTSSQEEGIEIQTKKSFVDKDQKNFYLEFSMKNGYPNGIISELSEIVVDLNTCKVIESELNILDGILKFDEISEKHNLSLKAKFAEACTPTGYKVKANNYLTYDGTSNKTLYSSEFKTITPESDVIFEDQKSVFDYDVILQAVNGSSKIELNSAKRYRLSLGNRDLNTTIVNTSSDFQKENVNSITIESNDASKIQLIEPSDYLTDSEKWKTQLTFKNINDVDLYIQTYDTSGVVNLNVIIEYTNNRDENHKIKTTTSITVLSGEPTAFSINSAGVVYNLETKWFENKFLISASDKYNNPINIPSKINVSAMADFRDANGDGIQILHGKFNPLENRLSKNDNRASFQTADNTIFQDINIERDYLLLFGDVTASEALGKWDIEDATSDTLFLKDRYSGDEHTDLGFAIGHNYLKEICSSESKEWEVKIDSTDKNYQLDDEGKTYVTLKFPPYMIGKKIALSVNFSGKESRSGEVDFATLHSFEGVKLPEDITIESNATALHNINIRHSFQIDTGTDDLWFVRNSGVRCTITTENISGFGMIDTLHSSNKPITDISQCGTDNISFFDISIKLIDEEKGGSIKFETCQVYSFTPSF